MGIFARKKKCSRCGTVLRPRSYFKGKKVGGIGDLSILARQMDELDSAAYQCRICGTLICRGCILVGSSCPKCGSIVFDSVEDESELHRA